MKSRKLFIIISFCLLFLVFGQVLAAGLVPCGRAEDDPTTAYNETDPCGFCHFFVMFNNIVKFVMFRLAPVVATLGLVYGGMLFLFGGGSPDTLSRAKSVMSAIVIGLVVLFGAWIIVDTVITKTGIVESPSLLKWYEIECPTE